jgi:hypothetical protein
MWKKSHIIAPLLHADGGKETGRAPAKRGAYDAKRYEKCVCAGGTGPQP